MEKLLTHLKFLLFIGAFVLIFTGCKDDNGGNPEPVNNLLGTWTVTNSSLDISVDGQSLTDYFINVGGLSPEDAASYAALFEAIFKGSLSGSITFKDDHTYVSNFADGPDDGTWNLSADGKKLTMDAGTIDETVIDIISLTSSTANLSFTQEATEDMDDDPLTPDETLSIDIDLTLIKS